MSFVAHYDRLQIRLRTLRKAEIGAWVATVTLTLVGAQFAVGDGASGMAFNDIHVPLAAVDQLTALGVNLQESNGRASGLRGAAGGLIMALKFVVAILSVGALFRLNVRWFLIFLLSGLALGAVGTSFGNVNGGRAYFRYAHQHEFGIGVKNPDAPDAEPWEKRDREIQLRRIAQGAAFRDLTRGPLPGTAAKAAALSYVAAEVAYIQKDPARTARRLNALTAPVFEGSGMADQRIRQMQAYVEAHGQSISATAYRAHTGIPLPVLDLMAKVMMWVGSLAFIAGLGLSVMNQDIHRRLKRIAAMMEQLKPARIAAVTRGEGGFGRAAQPNPHLAAR